MGALWAQTTVNPSSQPVANTAGFTTFTITSDTNWTVSDDAEWLSVSPANGHGGSSLTATYEANPGTSSRTATITVTADDVTRTVTVVQAAADYLT
ncbi:MAG TPA: BACON domain-containing protein, partial [bacterium]|nr:BACON domain-containing protein [bacterium]